jgi:hypothetical protein
MSGPRHVAVHGHFYQPPREHPWLETVEVEDSARPFHDWNARITAECYAPNTAARRVDADGRIIDVVDNFARISFNVGATLLDWLGRERPDVYRGLLAADRESVRTRGGHGNALAQPFAHVILPLASRRDKVTQVRWGLTDFRARFGRQAEGMWLPETAVDRETLAVLAEEGLAFTVLSPHQAARVREPGRDWEPVGAAIDPSRAYRCDPGGGRPLALFFYDAPISHAIAFERLLDSGDALAARLLGGFDDRRQGAQLVHVATDGESYGHHKPFGDMALAAALERIEKSGAATLTNYGAFLAAHPPGVPRPEVEIVERSSWSCAHGVERWRADCGCRAGHPGWQQRWRAPLREALEWLAAEVDLLFEARAGALVKDPWAARDDYAAVLLDRSPAGVAAFLARHQLRPLDADDRVLLRRLLELERHRLLMFTSCGWFFDELSGIETLQVLRYAARAVQLASGLGAPTGLEADLMRRLQAAPSNLPEHPTGDLIYRRLVRPSVVDLSRVAAHHAITAPFHAEANPTRVHAYQVERLDWWREASGETSLSVGRVRVISEVTGESEESALALLHFGDHDFQCAVRAGVDDAGLLAMRDDLFRRFAGGSLAEVVRALDAHAGGRSFGIRDVFLEERRQLLAQVSEAGLASLEASYRRVYEDNRRLLLFLRESDAPPPDALAVAVRYVLEHDVAQEVAALRPGPGLGSGVARLRELIAEARVLGLELALPKDRLARDLTATLGAAVQAVETAAGPAPVTDALTVLEVARELDVQPDLWEAQTRLVPLWRRRVPVVAPLCAALGFASGPA